LAGPGQRPRIAQFAQDWVPTLMRHALGCENALSDYSTGQDAGRTAGQRALVVESWSQRAVRHGNAIYVFDKFGNATALDLHYRPLPQQAPMRRRPHCIGSADPLPQPLTSGSIPHEPSAAHPAHRSRQGEWAGRRSTSSATCR
jgi:hypothetical protein